ncbi:MAG: hypothetical protein A3H91_11205 [Gammaproteobacteria bacterium RIFCSPLOWO2_02_FULL_61_13]|nr:MAG: hypothetical protein A3H91_11205 [Gammaproteobacteria bacterium RIFCSPLOWO2_02_FULL_61_13]
MHPVTHLLAGWTVSEMAQLRPRDRAIVTWACVVPDIDGIGYAIDLGNKLLGRPDLLFYETYHHNWGHGVPAALLVAMLAWYLAEQKQRTAWLAFLTFHLHLLMDLVGSRGSNPLDIWAIPYLSPLSNDMILTWDGQWPLTSWQNTVLTMVLMFVAAAMSVRRGYSPVCLFSQNADEAFVATLRQRFRGRNGSNE